jgi:predicted dinucleotide-binding enzyme
MKIAVLGTGVVGVTIANKLIELGHEVCMGSRTADNQKATAWAGEAGDRGSHGTYADAASFGEIVFNCTNGGGTLAALEAAGAENLQGKVLLDLSNPLDFSRGMPPTLFVSGDDSLGEQVQRALPDTRVVKTLNTINCQVMVDAGRVPGEHTVFVSGNDEAAKTQVTEILRNWFGHRDVLDLGDISTARGVESYLPLWLRMWGALGTGDFNVKVVRAAKPESG